MTPLILVFLPFLCALDLPFFPRSVQAPPPTPKIPPRLAITLYLTASSFTTSGGMPSSLTIDKSQGKCCYSPNPCPGCEYSLPDGTFDTEKVVIDGSCVGTAGVHITGLSRVGRSKFEDEIRSVYESLGSGQVQVCMDSKTLRVEAIDVPPRHVDDLVHLDSALCLLFGEKPSSLLDLGCRVAMLLPYESPPPVVCDYPTFLRILSRCNVSQ